MRESVKQVLTDKPKTNRENQVFTNKQKTKQTNDPKRERERWAYGSP